MKKVIGIVFMIFILIGGAIYFNLSRNEMDNRGKQATHTINREELPKINFQAPSFSLSALDGKNYSLEDTKGKPVMINFWASWCGPCKLEAPELSSLYKQYEGKFTLYAINLTNTESSLNDVKGFAENFGYSFPILLDEKGEIAEKYLIKPIPTTYFVNSDGIIVDQILGYGGKGALTTKLKALISGSDKP